MLHAEVIRMEETYMALFMQTGNPVFYTAAKNGGQSGQTQPTEYTTPPKPEG